MPCRAVVALWLLCCPVLSAAETLTFSDVLVAGLKNAFDRQIGEQNLLAAEAAVDEDQAEENMGTFFILVESCPGLRQMPVGHIFWLLGRVRG